MCPDREKQQQIVKQQSYHHHRMDNNNLEIPVWFAMSAPFCRELKAQQLLDKRCIESFIPMRYDVVAKKGGKKSRELVPAIHNLLFVRTTRSIIQEMKREILFLQYLTQAERGKNIPIIVPERQMQQFIAVSETNNEQLIYLKPEEINLKRGTPVRIHGGAFDGVEGIFVKVKGIRSRRVVVLIKGVTAVVTAEIQSDLIEVLSAQ